uniref:Uncharacterized protein n=1 Tax=Pithovirus LCPAC403 TaxID=2506596 RepID=A0A481ZCZ7_9VIRU|nr:MAG: hypothetical protein LCPAC403_03360 [Pithovirus LCPAC403]
MTNLQTTDSKDELLFTLVKLCPFCKVKKPASDFSFAPRCKGKTYPLCKICEPKEKNKTKKCNECGNEKTFDEFGFKGGGRRNAKCKECKNIILNHKRLKKRQHALKLLAISSKKWCSYCETEMNIDEFYKTKNGYYPICKTCKPKEKRMVKICNECGDDKTFDEFTLSDGKRQGKCKDCCNAIRRGKRFVMRTTGTKHCSGCKDDINVSEFFQSLNRFDGLSVYCKSCSRSREAKRRNTLEGHISVIFNDIIQQSKQKNRDVLIEKKDIVNLYHEQKDLCKESGIQMTYVFKPRTKAEETTHLNPAHYCNISVDRIDPAKGYIVDNIQLVCCIVNIMKQSLQQEEFVYWCQHIGETNSETMTIQKDVSKATENPHLDLAIKRRLKTVKDSAKERGREDYIEITAKDISSMYYNQNGKCALSGVEMTLRSTRSVNKLLSIDRIDSTGDYTANNIQLICRVINFMKGDIPQDIFIKWCKRISNF